MLLCVAVSLVLFVSGCACGIFTCFFVKYYDCPRSGVTKVSAVSDTSKIPTPAEMIPADIGCLGATHQRPIQFRFL
jgi:hypothetical protein